MAGGKGGSQTTTVEVPEYIEEAAKRNLARAQQISQIGYTPYYGPDVAAFTPLQEASMQNLAGTAGAFGLATPAGGPMSGMPAPQEFAGGISGYSSAPMFEEALDEFGRRRPAQKAYIDAMFIDPVGGGYTPIYQPVAPIEPVAPVVPTTPSTPSVPVVPSRPTITADPYSVTDRPEFVDSPIFTPETDPYGPTVSIPDVIKAREELEALPEPLTVVDPVTQEEVQVLPPIVPAAGGLDPQVGDVIDNAALQAAQNAVVEEAFDNFGAVLAAGQRGELTPEQVAAANPAFNPEIALANAATPVTVETPEGSYTVPAGSLGSADFAAATGGTYVPPTEPFVSVDQPGNLGTFVGGGVDPLGTIPAGPTIDFGPQEALAPVTATTEGGVEFTYTPRADDFTVASTVGSVQGVTGQPAGLTGPSSPFVPTVPLDTSLPAVQDTMEQYSMAGQSALAAGIRNIGGAYAQSPAGGGDLVETIYKDGKSTIVGVEPAAEETFGADLLRSLTDPDYDPEGTVLSRLLGGVGELGTQPEDMNAMQLAGREAALGGTDAMREYLSSGAYASATGSAPSSSLSGGATTDRLYAAQAEKQAIQAQAAVDAAAANQAVAARAAAPTGRFIVQRYDEDTPQVFTDQAAAERYARAFGTTAVPETIEVPPPQPLPMQSTPAGTFGGFRTMPELAASQTGTVLPVVSPAPKMR